MTYSSRGYFSTRSYRLCEGRRYRQDLIDEAIAEGIRAHGPDFNEEAYRKTLEGERIDTIKIMRDDWKRMAGHLLKGGRQTQDVADAQPSRENDIPATAYRDV